MSRWVFKHDGSIQCEGTTAQTLDEAKAELALIVGETNILGGEARSVMVIALCGIPSGRVNAFELSDEGISLFDNGINPHDEWHYWLFDLTAPANPHFMAAAEPGIPFPMKISPDLLFCRDCPFPMGQAGDGSAWDKSVTLRLEDLLRQFSKIPTGELSWLKGYELQVFDPKSGGGHFDLRSKRLNITVDANNIIENVKIG